MKSAADLFTNAALPAVLNPPPPEFRTAFLSYLSGHEQASASHVRELYGIPGNNDVGGEIRGLCREGLITQSGYDTAKGLTAKGRLTRLWRITDKGRAAMAESEAANV